MPNIEIYGLTDEEALSMEEKIKELFNGKPWEDEYVITTISSKVQDKKGQNMPFLRLCSTASTHTMEIFHALEKLNIDIELLNLGYFFPKKE